VHLLHWKLWCNYGINNMLSLTGTVLPPTRCLLVFISVHSNYQDQKSRPVMTSWQMFQHKSMAITDSQRTTTQHSSSWASLPISVVCIQIARHPDSVRGQSVASACRCLACVVLPKQPLPLSETHPHSAAAPATHQWSMSVISGSKIFQWLTTACPFSIHDLSAK